MVPPLLPQFLTSDNPEHLLAGVCGALLRAGGIARLSPLERELLDAAAPPPPALIAQVRDSLRAGEDTLGDLFCAIRGTTERRDRGQFYTPTLIVNAMNDWVLAHQPARVVDAGCGSGRYTVALRRAGYDGQIVAVDLDPLACLMTRAALAAVELPDAEVRCGDFLTMQFPSVDGVTGWVGNPPYLRHHNLPTDTKAWAKTTGREMGVPVSGLAGLHALFYLAVATHAQVGDVGAFITSSEWLDARYGQTVRHLLTGRLGLERLDVVNPAVHPFDDATTTAAIACFHVGHGVSAPLVRTVDTVNALRSLTAGVPVPRAFLTASERWGSIPANPEPAPTGFVPLGQHMRVSRGIATGANKFFTLTREEADQLGLADWAVPVIARADEVLRPATPGVIRGAGTRKVLLVLPDRAASPAVDAHVSRGETNGLHTGYINASRPAWYRITTPTPPDAFATYMARQPPVFAGNPDGCLNLNTVHGLRRRDTFPADLVPVLVAWLNEHRDELVGGRVYAGGLRKVEPKEMESFLVPDIAELRAWANVAPASIAAERGTKPTSSRHAREPWQ